VSLLHVLWVCAEKYVRRRGRLARTAASDGLTDVVAALNFDQPNTIADLVAIERSCAWCFEAHRVQLVGLYLARNGKRAVLVFRAPDAESVRLAHRQLAISFARMWS
jgi:hypothetical protein